jgi:hypothetical protein
VRSDDTVFDFGLRALFNAGHEVGWVAAGDRFQVWLAAGEASRKVALADGQVFDLAVRDIATGRLIRASDAPEGLVAIDTLAAGREADCTSCRLASRWLVRFPTTPVLVALDATEYQGSLTPPGSGFRTVRRPRAGE